MASHFVGICMSGMSFAICLCLSPRKHRDMELESMKGIQSRVKKVTDRTTIVNASLTISTLCSGLLPGIETTALFPYHIIVVP